MDPYKDQVAEAKTMQIATLSQAGPWVCTVYFVLYEGKYYWLSEPHRRHSEELAEDPRCAATVVIRRDIPVVGIQFSGEAHVVRDDNTVKHVLDLYIAKYGVGDQFYSRYTAGVNRHDLYCFEPQQMSVFDETKNPA